MCGYVPDCHGSDGTTTIRHTGHVTCMLLVISAPSNMHGTNIKLLLTYLLEAANDLHLEPDKLCKHNDKLLFYCLF
jgi:hypothetical protein